MKAISKYIVLALSVGLFASCQDDVDNNYSKYKTAVELSTSVEEIVLNESMIDDEALTVSWTPAYDFGAETVTSYKYEIYMLTSKSSDIVEYEDDFIFERTYTHGDLQKMLVDHFKQTTSTNGQLRFRVTATFENPHKLILPDVSEKTIKIKTYGPKQFKADEVYMAGTAVGAQNIKLTASANNADVYVWNGSLSAGKINFPILYGDEQNVIVPASNTDQAITGEAMAATVKGAGETTAAWTIPAATAYRVTVNFAAKTVTIIDAASIIEIDKIFLAGSATAGLDAAALEVKPTFENEDVYAWRADLKAGNLYLPIEFESKTTISIVPSGSSHDINDGQTSGFSQTTTATGTASQYWTIPADGTYRIVLDVDLKTITIYSSTTDLQPFTPPAWNHTQAPANTQYVAPVLNLWMWGGFGPSTSGNIPSQAYKMIPSLANPKIFVYYDGTALPRQTLNGQVGYVKFMVDDSWNNVYAYGHPTTQTNNTNTYHTINLNETVAISGGQSWNRYSFFLIPANCNYVVVDIEKLTVIFGQK